MKKYLKLTSTFLALGLILAMASTVTSCRDTFAADPLPEVQFLITVTDSADILIPGSTVQITTSEDELYEGVTDSAGYWKSPKVFSARTHVYVYAQGFGSNQTVYTHTKEDPDDRLGVQRIYWDPVVGPDGDE